MRVDRGPGRAVRERDVGDPGRGDDREQGQRACPRSARDTTTMPTAKTVSTNGFAAIAEPEPEPPQERAGEHEQEGDGHDVHDRGVAGEEPGEVRRVAGYWAVARSKTRKSESWLPSAERTWYARISATNRLRNSRRSREGGRGIVGHARALVVGPPRPRPASSAGWRRPVAHTSAANVAWAAPSRAAASSVRPATDTSQPPSSAPEHGADRKPGHDPREAPP